MLKMIADQNQNVMVESNDTEFEVNNSLKVEGRLITKAGFSERFYSG